MTRSACAVLLAAGLVAPAFAEETITERETYEKRSMKIETIPPPRVDERSTYEETTRRETERRPAEPEIQVEKRTRIEPGPVIREKRTETVESEDD